MAAVMMGSADDKNGGNPVFHDFLGMSCEDAPPAIWAKVGGGGRAVETVEASVSVSASAASTGGGHGLVSGSSDLGSEGQILNNFGPDINTQLLGRKRSNSDSAFMGLLRERVLPMASDSPESSRMLKMLPMEVMSERPRRSYDDVVFTSQPPPRPTSSVIVHPPMAGRPDSVASRWERSTPLNSGSMMHYTSSFGQTAMHVDKLSSCALNDSRNAAPLGSQAAADEGSRTGIKGSGILNAINSGGGSGERKSAGTLPSDNRMAATPRIAKPESSNILGRRGITTTSRQMTIFYAGQAHVFDDVHPKKADMIMALAGSDGGSWSTTYALKSPICPPGSEGKPPGVEKNMAINKVPFSRDLNSRLSVQGNTSHGGFNQAPRLPVLGDRSILTSGGRDVRDMGPAKVVEPDTEPKRNML